MKRFLLTMLILVLFATLVACGGKTATTTTQTADTTDSPVVTTPQGSETAETPPIVTTPEQTKPVETTPFVTTPTTTAPETEPVVLEPTSISYSMGQGGYLYTQFDEAGRTAVRYLYDRDTMQKTEQKYNYTYDGDGKLSGYAITDRGGVITNFALAYGDDGKSVTATDPSDDSYYYEIVWDENGKILSETILQGGEPAFRFEYDENGFVVLETMYFRGMAIEYESFYDEDKALITCILENAATELCVTYNEAGYPISLEGHQLSNDYWHVYTYNRKMLCTSANFLDGSYEYYYEFAYDDNDRLNKVVLESDDGIDETGYVYDDADRVIRMSVVNSTHNGIVNYSYVTTYEYDEKDRVVKTVSYEDGDETSYSVKWTYGYTYNEEGLLVGETADFTTSDEGFIASFKDTYEYDEFGREIKFTMVEYQENGNVLDTTVTETVYAEDGSVAKEIVSRYNSAGLLVDQDVTDYTT